MAEMTSCKISAKKQGFASSYGGKVSGMMQCPAVEERGRIFSRFLFRFGGSDLLPEVLEFGGNAIC